MSGLRQFSCLLFFSHYTTAGLGLYLKEGHEHYKAFGGFQGNGYRVAMCDIGMEHRADYTDCFFSLYY